MSSPLTDYQLRHFRALIERERTRAGETAAGILLAATLARLQHCERRLAQVEGALADIARGDYSDPLCMKTPEQRARQALAAWAPIEGQEP